MGSATTDNALQKIVTGRDYIESLRGGNLKVFLFGKQTEGRVDHPMIRPSINAVAETYDLAVRAPELAAPISVHRRKR